ncbi:MAG: hypothetical protein WBX78_13755, partial [Pseudolabrys sp.]
HKVREARRFDKMAKKRIATVNRKLGISISCRVQKPVVKDLDAYRKSLKLSRSAALVKLATDHLAGLKEPAEKLWEGAVEHMFPTGNGAKGDDRR